MNKNQLIAVPIGDPAGVGPEIVLKSFALNQEIPRGTALVCGDMAVLDAVRKVLEIPVSLVSVSSTREALNLGKEQDGMPTVPVLDQQIIDNVKELKKGTIGALSGKAATAYIQSAVELCNSGKADGIATAPINKESLRAAQLDYIGHTEMISEMSNGNKGITMFQVDKLKIFFHSRHVSLRRAIDLVEKDQLFDSIKTACDCLVSIGIHNPHLAVAGLNPHSSDGGLFGDEEAGHIKPAIERAVANGINAVGPIPADSVFHQAAEGRFDAVLSLYHDQGHIASKCYDFYRVVSVTFGYPFIRTSVDHGTAFDIAWKGVANPVSMSEAIRLAFSLAEQYQPSAIF